MMYREDNEVAGAEMKTFGRRIQPPDPIYRNEKREE
jgi:hypothetical protein